MHHGLAVSVRLQDHGRVYGGYGIQLSHGQDRIFEMAVNLKAVITAMRQTAHMVEQKTLQDRLMSGGGVLDAILNSY
jgi:hypothetical protein